MRAAGVRTWASIPRLEAGLASRLDWITIAVLVAGLAVRLRLASLTYFELDESFHAHRAVSSFPDLWDKAHEPTHPPLLIILTHYVRQISESEIALRMIPVLSGALFPWWIYRWLGIVWTKTAGFAAVVILTFSPMLIGLSSVLRQYTPALLFFGISLYCVERAMREGSTRWMWWFAISLQVAVLFGYITAFFCVSLGVYVLLRFREPLFTRNVKMVWAFSQLVALGLYAHLLFKQIIPKRASHQGLVGGEQSYFAGMFPAPTDNPVLFALRGAYGQFVQTFNSAHGTNVVALLGAALFLGGVVLIWVLRRRESVARKLAMTMFLLTPFLLACIGAYSKTYPFGRSRQTIFLAMFIAIGIAICCDRLWRSRSLIAVPASVLLLFLWYGCVRYNPLTIAPVHKREVMHQMLDYVQSNIPKGSRILVEVDTTWAFLHYLGGQEWPTKHLRGQTTIAGYRLFDSEPAWQKLDTVWESLSLWNTRHDLDESETVWVIDNGLRCELCQAVDSGAAKLPPGANPKRFGTTMMIFQVPAGFHPLH